jgi:1-deoxy-D-xylulose-5-phosphate synthase
VLHNFASNGKRKVALFGLGNMCPIANKAAVQLVAEGYDVAVINPRFTKPIDAGTHEFFGRAADVIVTLEDHVLMGGYGSTVLELFGDKNITTPIVRIGWPDQFIEHATTQDELRRKYGLTVENAVAKVKAQFAETTTTRKLAEVA